MGRAATWVAIALVAGTAAVAAADALRGGGTTSGSEPRPRPVVPAGLRQAGLSGVLLISDERCRRAELELPALSLTRVEGPTICATLHERALPKGCEFGYGDRIEASGGSTATVLAASCAPGLFRELREALSPRCDRLDVESIAWPRPGRVAAVVRCGRNAEWPEEILTLYQGRHRVAWRRFPGADLWDLRASPRGSFLGVRLDGRLLVLDAGGRPAPLPAEVRRGQAIAWSPDERWTAVATGGGVAVFTTGDPHASVFRLPVPSVDVAWRPEP